MQSLERWGLLAGAALRVVVLPGRNALPAGSPLRLSDFTLNLFGKFLAYAILALGIDLIWGYTGVLSLGHGVFFGLGAYAMGMHLMLEIGTRGGYFSIITQARARSTWLMFNRNAMNLGGTNGLSGFKSIFGFTLNSAAPQRGLYVATALCLCGPFVLCRAIVRSPAGRVLIAIRDSETRVLFSGYSPAAFK